MINCEYIDLSGGKQPYDLDAVIDIVRGLSQKKNGWIALIVFDPVSNKFIELRDSPPDPRGNSIDEAEEVEDSYVNNCFQLGEKDIDFIKESPLSWSFIDRMNQ